MLHEQCGHDDGADVTLQRIEAGGRNLLMITRRRIADVLDALDAGDFMEAQTAISAAAETINPLAHAQHYIAIAQGAELITTGQLTVGMEIIDVGVVSAVEHTTCDAVRCRGHVKVTAGEHELDFGGDREVYVRAADPSDNTP